MRELSQETKMTIRYWLRGYCKGYGVDLHDYLEDEPQEICKKILEELCEISGEDFESLDTSWNDVTQ